MAETAPELEKIAKPAWGMIQRVAMEIAGKPAEQREAAFAIAERSLRETTSEHGLAGKQTEAVIKVLMNAMREVVRDIDIGGSPQGGNA